MEYSTKIFVKNVGNTELAIDLAELSQLVSGPASLIFDNMTAIGTEAFKAATNLSYVSLLNCSIVGSSAFMNCTNLRVVSLPNCTSIGVNAFYGCNLTNVYLPKASGAMLSSAFSGCNSIDTLTILQTPSISSYYNNTQVYINRLNILGSNTLWGENRGLTWNYNTQFAHNLTTSAKEVYAPNVRAIGSMAFIGYYTEGGYGYYITQSCSRIYCPNVQEMGWQAFRGNDKLTSIYLPKCTYIHADAFTSCTALTAVYLLATTVPSTYSNISMTPIPVKSAASIWNYGINALQLSIYVRASLVSQFKQHYNWKYNADQFVGLTDEEIEVLDEKFRKEWE